MIKKIRTKDFLSWSLFLCSLAISQTYLNNYYDVTQAPISEDILIIFYISMEI